MAHNGSDDEDTERSPLKEERPDDNENELAPNNAAGQAAKSLVAEASIKGKIVERRKAVQ